VGSRVTSEILAGVKGSLRIEFSDPNSVYFKALNCICSSIDNIPTISESILQLFTQKKWNGNYVIVSRLYKAGSTTCIVAEASNGMIDIRAKNESKDVDFADVNAGLYVAFQQNIGLLVLAEPGLIPVFGLSRVRVRPLISSQMDDFQGSSGELLRNAPVDVSIQGIDLTRKSVEDIFEFAEIP
jgi:hypothetical protein